MAISLLHFVERVERKFGWVRRRGVSGKKFLYSCASARGGSHAKSKMMFLMHEAQSYKVIVIRLLRGRHGRQLFIFSKHSWRQPCKMENTGQSVQRQWRSSHISRKFSCRETVLFSWSCRHGQWICTFFTEDEGRSVDRGKKLKVSEKGFIPQCKCQRPMHISVLSFLKVNVGSQLPVDIRFWRAHRWWVLIFSERIP